MTLKPAIAARLLAAVLGHVALNASQSLAGPLYSIVDLGAVTNDGDGPKVFDGAKMGTGYIANTDGRIVSDFDKTPTAMPQEYTAPYGEKVVEDGNIHGRYVGTEAVYDRPKRPAPGHVAIDLITLQYHAAVANKDLTHWTDLHGLFAKKGWDLQSADKIDDHGRIEGMGLLHGVEHAYLLIPKGLKSGHDFPSIPAVPASQQITGGTQPVPVPEPASLALFGLVALAIKARRDRTS